MLKNECNRSIDRENQRALKERTIEISIKMRCSIPSWREVTGRIEVEEMEEILIASPVVATRALVDQQAMTFWCSIVPQLATRAA